MYTYVPEQCTRTAADDRSLASGNGGPDGKQSSGRTVDVMRMSTLQERLQLGRATQSMMQGFIFHEQDGVDYDAFGGLFGGPAQLQPVRTYSQPGRLPKSVTFSRRPDAITSEGQVVQPALGAISCM
jgi:hypothetical protein